MSNNMNRANRIVFLCDWLPPDFGAVGQYAVAFCEDWAAAGNDVTLVGFSSQKASVEKRSIQSGHLTVQRIYRPSYDKSAFVKRAFWTFGANIALLKGAWDVICTCDEIRFTGSPPFMLHFVVPIALVLGKKTRYRITDFHPEGLIAALGYTPWWVKPISALTNFWRRRVDVVEVLGEDQRRAIVRSGVSPQKVELVRDPSPVEFSETMVPAPVPEPISGRAVILYSGNWGVAHDVDTFVLGFKRFCEAQPERVGVWLNATGKRADIVANRLQELGLPYARTKPVPLEQLPNVLLAADIHLITLNVAFVAYALPSKVYACVASGRSVLFIGSPDSDVHLVCSTSLPQEAYRRVDVGDVEGVSRAISELLDCRANSVK